MVHPLHIRFDEPEYVCIQCGGRYFTREEIRHCPHCDEPVPKTKTPAWAWLLIGGLLVIIIVLVVHTTTQRTRQHHVPLFVPSVPAAPP